MAVIQTAESGRRAAYIKEFMFDKKEDLDELPVTPECKAGSTALCIETSEIFVLGSDNVWHLL